MNLQEMMRQAQRMKAKMEKVQEEMAARTYDGTAGGGMVVVSANGRGQVTAVKVEKEVVNPEELEMLQDLIVAATNQALTRANEAMQAEMSKVTNGVNVPGLF